MEDDGEINLRRRQARFTLIKDKNEFNKNPKRNKSTEYKESLLLAQDFGDVSENEEEENSDSSNE